MRELVVLGHQGMLGQMVMHYFGEKGYSIKTIGARFDEKGREAFLEELKSYPEALIINCIGKIKQKTEDSNLLLWSNALLPLALKASLLPTQTLIQPSTDCVFDGKKGEAYESGDTADAVDAYGWSKYLGEEAVKDRPNTIIFRVSIIGPDTNTEGKGLLAWFLSNPSSAKLKGFTNHLWNGITTLEWCKQLEKLLDEMDPTKSYFYQLGTEEYYSKYEMLKLFASIYEKDYTILPYETREAVDRRLVPQIKCSPLTTQLKELVVLPLK
jgi:dTDP-4-dehydrorhamnose reductase